MGIRTSLMTVTGGLLLSILASYSPLAASDHVNIEEGLPVQVEDAYPIKYRAVELELQVGYEDLDEAGSRLIFKPEIKAGLFRNTHVWLAGSILSDTDEEDHSANLGFLYNFNTETLSTPAFAVAAEAEFDFDGSTNLTARGIVTKSCGVNRFHLNVDYIDVGSPDPGERGSRYRYGLGWTRPLSLETIFLADIFTERSQREGEDAETVAEVGLRHQLNPTTVIAGGLGVGLSGGAGSRDFTATLGISRSL